MLETIRLFCGYTVWADSRMFDALAPLTPEQWTRDLGSSLKSVRDTAVHLAGAEGLYLSRFRGVSPTATWNPADFPSPAVLRETWAPVAADLAFSAAQTQESLKSPLSYKNLKGEAVSLPLGPVVLQLTNHSTYHRGQVTTLLRQLGAQPRSTDLILYWMEILDRKP
jgi:uncharacterized damage-inducible protein DinB